MRKTLLTKSYEVEECWISKSNLHHKYDSLNEKKEEKKRRETKKKKKTIRQGESG